MKTLHLAAVILLMFLCIVLIVGQHSPQADIINNCVNSTNSTPCTHNYEQLYKSLAKSENHFNISFALYPGRSKPSSVRVFVSVYGPIITKDSTPAMYTWCMSCLYAAVPAGALEFFSLGSILVSPRTQELNIHIPLFCCNVSENKETRKKIIDGMLTRVLAELQDLAVSPGIQDPTLNTAECVIQGHEPSIEATGMAHYIRAILLCAFFSVMLLGPIITFFALGLFRNDDTATLAIEAKCKCCENGALNGEEVCSCQLPCSHKVVACYTGKNEDTFIQSAKYVCHLLLLTEIVIMFLVISVKNVPKELYIPIPCMFVEGIVICMVQCCTICDFCKDDKITSIYRRSVFIACANIISYHLCWLIVGIMINPTWGLTVLAVVCFVGVASFYVVYAICDATSHCGKLIHRCCILPAIFLGLCFVVTLTVLAGQSFYGKDIADQIMKTTLLYVVGGITWIFQKGQTQTNPIPNTSIDYSIPDNPDFGSSLQEGHEMEPIQTNREEVEDVTEPFIP